VQYDVIEEYNAPHVTMTTRLVNYNGTVNSGLYPVIFKHHIHVYIVC